MVAGSPPLLGTDAARLFGLFLLGLCSAVYYEGAGILFLLDVVLIAVTAYTLLRTGWRSVSLTTTVLLALILLWLFGAVLTDVVRSSPAHNYIRGWSKIVIFGIGLIALAKLSQGRPTRLAAYLCGLAAASCLQTLFYPNVYQAGGPWKFGYAIPLALVCVVLASAPWRGHPPSTLRQIGLPLGMAMINLALGFRSLFVILFAVAAVTTLVHVARLAAPGRRVVTPVVAVLLIGGFGLGGWAIEAGYGRLASSGALGAAAQIKQQVQTQGDLGLLVGGRSESLASIQAIKDSPILGHGSWAENPYYVSLQVLAMRERGREAAGGLHASALIPTHSYFFGAWVEAGVAGALFWATCLGLSVVAILRAIDLRSYWTPMAVYCCVQLIWNIPFSPFGADARFAVPAQLLAVVFLIEAGMRRPARARRMNDIQYRAVRVG